MNNQLTKLSDTKTDSIKEWAAIRAQLYHVMLVQSEYNELCKFITKLIKSINFHLQHLWEHPKNDRTHRWWNTPYSTSTQFYTVPDDPVYKCYFDKTTDLHFSNMLMPTFSVHLQAAYDLINADKDFAQDWVKALRSGNYNQCQDVLCYDGEYCCLGVASSIQGIPDSQLCWNDSLDSVPFPITEWSASDSLNDLFIALNDTEGMTFNQIASFIELLLELKPTTVKLIINAS